MIENKNILPLISYNSLRYLIDRDSLDIYAYEEKRIKAPHIAAFSGLFSSVVGSLIAEYRSFLNNSLSGERLKLIIISLIGLAVLIAFLLNSYEKRELRKQIVANKVKRLKMNSKQLSELLSQTYRSDISVLATTAIAVFIIFSGYNDIFSHLTKVRGVIALNIGTLILGVMAALLPRVITTLVLLRKLKKAGKF